MYRLFEKMTKAFPEDQPTQPPSTLFAFCRHYTKGMELSLLLMSISAAMLAILEVSLFSYMGQLVDWLTAYTPETLFVEQKSELIKMAVMLLVVLPVVVFFHSAILHQALLGNYPMSIRWLAHRYLLRQSVSFYQNEFAGRIATKVLQTSLAVRETVTKATRCINVYRGLLWLYGVFSGRSRLALNDPFTSLVSFIHLRAALLCTAP